jgi:peptidoglycan/LPS O-acetylase OafA/YrhL
MTEMQQRSVRTLFVLGCAVALLLPVLSLFDGDAADRDAFDNVALAVAAVVAAVALTALAVIEPQRRSLARWSLAVLTDPRSPPRA